ncbi:stage III sporulation protein AF [Bacillus gobiensis]|uniref:stage III sporulation protein AF n=1 Tax=Bacillus gobiensis TaxID=1441095 RepID=UPI003D1A8066
MSFLTEWLTNIIVFILLAIVIDLLLPNSVMQKYVKMIISLLLILVLLQPIFSIFNADPEKIYDELTAGGQAQSENIKNQLNDEKKEIQAASRAYILEQMAVQLKNEAKKPLIESNYTIEKLDFETSSQLNSAEDVKQIIVHLTKETEEETIPSVAPVEIGGNENSTSPFQKKEAEAMKNQLAETWEVDPGKVTVILEGGEVKKDG